MKIACISLGCPKNQVDLDVMVHILLSAGHETVADLAEADVILVNTCGFIESAKTEAIENILEACAYKQQNPNLKVIVTGCLAERYRSQIEEEIPEVVTLMCVPTIIVFGDFIMCGFGAGIVSPCILYTTWT